MCGFVRVVVFVKSEMLREASQERMTVKFGGGQWQ